MIPGLLDTLLSFAAPYFKHDVPAVPTRANANDTAVPSAAKTPGSESVPARVAVEAEAFFTAGTAILSGGENPDSVGHHVEDNAALAGPSGTFFFEAFDSQDAHYRRNRAIQVLHIIRNFSFLESNARTLVEHEDLRRVLLRGLGLAVGTQHLEVRHACLDIIENIAPHIVLRSRHDPLQLRLRSLAHDTDRALSLGAIRSLTRLAGNDANETFSVPLPPVLIRRLLQLLLVWDEGIVSAVLDMFYQYSSFSNVDMSAYLARHVPGNIVRVLIKFLSWKVTVKPAPPPPLPGPAPYLAPSLPVGMAPVIRTAVSALPPTTLSATMPLNPRSAEMAVTTPTSELVGPRTLRAIYAAPPLPVSSPKEYQIQSTQQSPQLHQQWTPAPLASGPAGSAFTTLPVPPTMGVSVPGLQPYMAHVPAATPGIPPQLPFHINMCQWTGCADQVLPGVEEGALFEHVVSTHLRPSEERQPYVCRWCGCDKFSDSGGTPDLRVAIAHLQTHRPLTKAAPAAAAPAVVPFPAHQRQYLRICASAAIPQAVRMAGGSGTADLDGAVGIPLTTALVLRNLARSKKCQALFVPYESELTSLM
ncbi:MAG: hypothetical protein BJ554DRAFT_5154, partial [Olpidium bornovanus]